MIAVLQNGVIKTMIFCGSEILRPDIIGIASVNHSLIVFYFKHIYACFMNHQKINFGFSGCFSGNCQIHQQLAVSDNIFV